jgi:hypothetical protein
LLGPVEWCRTLGGRPGLGHPSTLPSWAEPPPGAGR